MSRLLGSATRRTATEASGSAGPAVAVASRHEVSADGLTYTFTLREGVTFHDGQELTPQDVVTSLTEVRDNALNTSPARPVRFHSRVESGALRVSTMSWPSAAIVVTFARRAESR
jgi:peptide/nickel transport system substrate-binding protein